MLVPIAGGHDRRTGEERRQELVRAAYETIAEQGFEGLRTREVAARAGISIATLHYYFPSKEDLIRAVVDQLQAEFERQAVAIAARGTTARERLRAALWQAYDVNRDQPELQIVLHELFLRSLRDPAVQMIFAGMDSHWQQAIEEILRVGIDEGSFRADLDVPATAAMIIAFLKGISIQLARAPHALDYARVVSEFERWLIREQGTGADAPSH
jgi:AcrR family transcriptional regulator